MKNTDEQVGIRVTTDRSQFQAWGKTDNVPTLPGFNVSRDTRVKQQTRVRMYSRVKTSQNETTGTTAYLQYEPSNICTAPMKLTLVPVDGPGMLPSELRQIETRFLRLRALRIEVTIEFSPMTGVDDAYVRRHGRFGRTQISRGQRGSRRGNLLIRIYDKAETNRFRVELELHSQWLRRHGVRQTSDFWRLPALLVPQHFEFVEVDFNKLSKFLRHTGRDAEEIIAACRLREGSLNRLKTFLKHVGLANIHRFIRPLPINQEIEKALHAWGKQWLERERQGAK